MPHTPEIGYNQAMTDDDFQTISDQIDELEGALMEWDIRGDGATARLPWLHQIITDLMEASAQTTDDDQDTRVRLAGVEYRARHCRKAILRRAGMEN